MMEKNMSNFLPESIKIEDGISALKTAGIWPKNRVLHTPAYNDDDGTLYLQIVPKFFTPKCIKSATSKVLEVQHPLSLKRNVCVVLESLKKDQAFKTMLAELGVTGDITVESKDVIGNIAQKYDTIIVDSDVPEKALKSLETEIANEPGKVVLRIIADGHRKHMKRKLSVLLRKSIVIPNASDSSFLIKVAHTGNSAIQIKENIMSIFRTWNLDARVYGGWSFIKTVGLKNGSSRTVTIYEATDMKIQKVSRAPSVSVKRKSGESNGSAEPKAKKKNLDMDAEKSMEVLTQIAKSVSANLKRKLPQAVQPNGQDNASPKPKKKKQRGLKRVEQPPASDDLVNMLINRAKQSVFSTEKETAVIASAPGNQSKKNKNKSPKKKGGAKNLLPVQKDGELSAAFKEDLMSRLQEFTRGTDIEDIIVAPDQTAAPVKAEKKPIIKFEGQARKTAEVKPVAAVSLGDKSPKKNKNKNKKNKSPNVVAPLANGNAQVNTEALGNYTPKKKKNKKNKTPQKVNLVAPMINGKLTVKAEVKAEAPGNNTPQKKKNKKNKTPQKVNLVSPTINGNLTVKAKVTKVVALESPGTKLKKKKNKSPKKAKVAAL